MRQASRRLTTSATMHATGLVTLLTAPIDSITRFVATTATRLREEEDGLSELTSGLLLAGGVAIIVLIVLAILQPWATNEANNLPTSGGGG